MKDAETGRKDLINTIDFEINKFDYEISRNGWNFWILLASLASLIWILLEELERADQEWEYSLFIFLVLSLIFEIIGSAKSLLSPSVRPQTSSRFYVANALYAPSRTSYLFALMRNIALIAIIFFVKDFIHFNILLLSVYVFYTLNILLVMLVSYFELPIPSKGNNRITFAANLLSILFFLVITTYLLIDIISGKLVIDIVEYKIGAILFGILFLVTNLLSLNQNFYQKEILSGTRRDLLLENIDYSEAKRQIEIVLLGMSSNDFLHDEIKNLLEIIQEFNSIYSAMNKKYAGAIEQLTKSDFKKMKSNELVSALQLISRLLDELDGDFESVSTLLQKEETVIKKMERKSLILHVNKNIDSTTSFKDKVEQALNSRREKFKELKQYHNRLLSFKEPIEKRADVLLKGKTRKTS